MGFHHLDQYASAHGAAAAVAPAARVLAVFVIAIGAALLPMGAYRSMTLLLVLVGLLGVGARVPLLSLVRRALPPFFFLLTASAALLFVDGGEVRFSSALLRGGAAVLAGVLLVSTTRFTELVEALRELRMPRVVTAVLGLAYRFLYLLTDEIAQLRRAAASRNAVFSRRVMYGFAASALMRSLARSERVYGAMLARGYTGDVVSLRPQPLDVRSVLFVVALAAVVSAIVVVA